MCPNPMPVVQLIYTLLFWRACPALTLLLVLLFALLTLPSPIYIMQTVYLVDENYIFILQEGYCLRYPQTDKRRTVRMPSALSDFEEITTIGTGSYGTCKKVKRKDDGKVYSTVQATFCVMGYIGFTCLVSIGFDVIFHREKFLNLNFIGLIYPVDLCVRFYAPIGYYAHLCFS